MSEPRATAEPGVRLSPIDAPEAPRQASPWCGGLSLTMKIALLLALPLAGAIGGSVLFARFVERTRSDGHVRDLAGTQVTLAAGLRDWVHMVGTGQEEDRAGLQERIAAFDDGFAALERGSQVPGGPLVPLPEEIGAPLDAVAGVWRGLKPELVTIAARPRAEGRFQEAYLRAEPELATLRERSQQVVLACVARSSRLQAEVLRTLSIRAGLMGVLFLAAIVLTRRYIVRPVLRMRDVAGRIGAGDFSQRLEVSSRDELSSLARAFNEMAAQVQHLLAARDRSEALERSQALNRAVLETAVDGITVIDAAGLVQSFNPAAERMFGWEAGEVIGRNVNLLMPDPYREAHDGYLRQYLETGEKRIIGHGREVEGVRKDGTRFPLQLGVSEMRVGDQRLFAGITRDISTQKRAARELTQKNLELERATQAKSAFLASMSHELRTPMNAIIGFSELLADGVAGPLPPEQRELVGHVLEAGKHLLVLINDILDLAKIEAGRVELRREPCSLAELVQHVRQIVASLAAKKRIQLSTDLPEGLPTLSLDPVRVKQILYNLLSNALKFSPQGGAVALEARRAGDRVEVSVTDHGPGIAAADLPRLFQPFEQLQAGQDKTEGTGLGLALVRQLVSLHGGEVRAESTVGQGSRFTFTLPCEARPAAGAAQGAPETPAGARPLVLVVEDDPGAAELISVELREAGYAIALSDQRQALERAEAEVPYAITLDRPRPGLDGLALLIQLKRSRKVRRVPVVIVSSVDDLGEALLHGAHDALVKPVAKGRLIEALERGRREVQLTRATRILLLGADPAPALRALAPLAGTCEVFAVRTQAAATAVFGHAPPQLAIVLAGGPRLPDELLPLLAERWAEAARVIFAGDRASIPGALAGRIAAVTPLAEVEATLAALVQAALPGMVPPNELPGRAALLARLDAIAGEGGSGLQAVALIAVTLPGHVALSLPQLEKRLRPRDFLVALPSHKVVLLASDVLPADLAGLKRRFLTALEATLACELSEAGVRVAFPSPEHGLTAPALVQSLLG